MHNFHIIGEIKKKRECDTIQLCSFVLNMNDWYCELAYILKYC